MTALQTSIATSRGGRDGHVTSSDGFLDFDVVRPAHRATRQGTDPEQLFAAGYAACFESAMLRAARGKEKAALGTAVTAEVTLNKSDEGDLALSVVLRGHVDGWDDDEVVELMREAHTICPYSRATRNNVDVQLRAA